MSHRPVLSMPDDAWDENGRLVTDAVFQHFAPALADARASFKSVLGRHADPVLREAVRLHNARSVDCEH